MAWAASFMLVFYPAAASANHSVSLAGSWHLRLDPQDEGLNQRWFAGPLHSEDSIRLPGTTDQAGYGYALDTNTMRYPVAFPYSRFPGMEEKERADEHGFLVRRHFFLGAAWYERDIEVPRAWQGRPLTLRLERAIWQTDAWVDGQPAGSADSLATPHEHPLCKLAPGSHRLTIRVDNRMIYNISTVTHSYGPESQSRWNGLVGRLELVVNEPVSIRRLEVFPAPDRRSARVIAVIDNSTGEICQGQLGFQLEPEKRRDPVAATQVPLRAEVGESRAEGVVELRQPAEAWDEFKAVRYRITAELLPDGAQTPSFARSTASALFGFRQIERQGRALLINGRRVFLRGTVDCAVYPRTGHPPMAVAEWEKLFSTMRAYGFNAVRYHTWCPPEAAFEAADRLGFYLSPETATWVDDVVRDAFSNPPPIGSDTNINAFIRAEIRRISETYGNHPSFALFCIGNEFQSKTTDWDAAAGWIEEAKRFDPRRLYTGCTARRHLEPDDFWVTHEVGGKPTRGIGPAHSDWDFNDAARAAPVPVICHETGARPVFPDYDVLLPKFTGPLKPYNLERFRDQLAANGLAGQIKDFQRASARFQLVQYKAEMEAMRRTADYAGYDLLQLNDFTGQSEALVGVLDPFWESKGVVSPAEVRSWNAPTVPLARFKQFTWSTTEKFQASIEVAHHGSRDLAPARAGWQLVTDSGRVLARGQFEPRRVPTGGVTRLGEIHVALAWLDGPAALTLRVTVGSSANAWRLWAYPPPKPDSPGQLVIATRFDSAAERALAEGRPLLLLARGLRSSKAARIAFESVYWSGGWRHNVFSSMGIVCDPRHPALAEFPNDGHSDWQWHELTAGATTFLFDDAPRGFQPIVQGVTDFHYNRLLGQVFEARVGSGRLLVCGYDLTSRLDRRHAARQFRHSLLTYANSAKFAPRHELSLEFCRRLFGAPG